MGSLNDRYDLVCENEHFFESWFKDSKSYQKQLDANEIVCPECDSSNISKSLMAPEFQKTNTKIVMSSQIVAPDL